MKKIKHNSQVQQDNIPLLVSIVIRTYFREKTLIQTLESIAELKYPKNSMEILVVKDSKDARAEKVVESFKQKYSNIRTILLSITINSATQARNLGIKHSSGKIVGITDDDIIIHPKSINSAMSIFKANDKVAAVTFPIKFETTSFIAKINHMRFIGIFTQNLFTIMPLTFFKKDILEKVGFYREDMGPPLTIHEDWELGSRLRKHGYTIIGDGNIVQRHLEDLNSSKKKEVDNSVHFGVKSKVEQGITMLRSYANSYLRRNYWSFFEVMKSSPLSQQIEYALYFLMPLIGLWLLQKPLYALAYLLLLISIVDAHSFIRGYYKVFSLHERLIYPIILVSIRVIRTYSAIFGMLINVIKNALAG